MGRKTAFFAGTMIFWLPILFFTTYIGFYEAYEVASRNHFLNLNYSNDFAKMLIIPAMIPTIFTAHTILNREKMTIRMIEKFNVFHSRVNDGQNDDFEESLLTKKEYEHLDFITQIEYCRDLRDIGKTTIANKYLNQYYRRYSDSKNPIEKAAALYSKTLISDSSVDQKSMHDSSKMAYKLISDYPESRIFQKLVFAYVIELPYIGYENALKRLREIENTLSDNYLLILIEIRKLYFLYRMNRITEIGFTSIEQKIDYNEYDHHQLDRLEKEISKVKNEIMLDNNDFEELELLLHQRRYRYKWNGKTTDVLQNNLGRMYRKKGDYQNSLKCFNENLTLGRSKDIPYTEGVALVNLGKTYFQMGDYHEVKKLSTQSLKVFTQMDLARGIIESLTLFVDASKILGDDCASEAQLLEKLEKENSITAQTN
jgi:tetratricopeptide (TPR) repeat protein